MGVMVVLLEGWWVLGFGIRVFSGWGGCAEGRMAVL